MAFRLCGSLVLEEAGFGESLARQMEPVAGQSSSSVLQSTSVPVSCLLLKFHSAADRLDSLIGGV